MSRRALVAAVAALLAVAGAAALLVTDGNGDDHGAQAGARDRWTALHPAQLSRTEVAAARVGRFVYVMGGFEQRSGATTAAVERYDIRRDRWRRVRSMPVGLNHPAAVAYRGNVYVVGGYTGRGDLRGEVASLLRYSPRRDRWTRLPDAPTKRAALAAGVVGGKLYAAGGANARRSARDARGLRLRAPPLDARPGHGARRASTSRALWPAAPSTCSPDGSLDRGTSRSRSATCRAPAAGSSSPTCASPAAGSARPRPAGA